METQRTRNMPLGYLRDVWLKVKISPAHILSTANVSYWISEASLHSGLNLNANGFLTP